MPDYTYSSVSVTTDPQTITFSSLGASLEGRSIPTLTATPVVFVVSSEDRHFAVTSVTTTQFVVDASAFGGATLPTNISIIVRSFDSVSTTSNAKSATVSRVRRLLKITGTNEILTDDEIKERIDDGVGIFSKHRPQRKRHEIIGNSEHEVALPSDWVLDFSKVQFVESPSGDQPPVYLEQDQFMVEIADTTSRTCDNSTAGASSVTASTVAEAGYFKGGEIVTVGDDDASETNWVSSDGNATSGAIALKNVTANTYDSNPYIRKLNHFKFLDLEPGSDTVSVVEYTTQHSHTDSSDTIPDNDFELFTWVIAELCALSIAAKYGKSISSTFDADSINNLAKSNEWKELAEVYRRKYSEHIGIADQSQQAVLTFIDTDSSFRHRREFLFHGRKFQ